MSAIPSWLGATAGQPAQAAQINQFLGAHSATYLYTATQKVAQSTAGSGGTNSNGLYIAQSFTTAVGQTQVGRVVLTLAETLSPAPLTVGLYANSAGAPTGAALVSVNVPKEFLTGSATAFSIPLPATVSASTQYWIVTSPVGDASNFFTWSKSNQVSGASTSTNGTTWTAQGYGLLYKVFDQSTTLPLLHTFEDSGARWTSLTYNGSNQISGLAEYTAAQASGYVQSNRTVSYSSGLPTAVA